MLWMRLKHLGTVLPEVYKYLSWLLGPALYPMVAVCAGLRGRTRHFCFPLVP